MRLVQAGATGEILFADGYSVPPSPIIAIRFTPTAVRFFWLASEQEHGVQIGRVADGDDGEVLVRDNDDITLTIWGIFEDEHWASLHAFVAAVKAGQQPGLGLGDDWTRYKEL